ncbi:Septin-domain-containing protein [Hyaloraphidium curvatum]|nr:Septin-domain-containing protein [Hyaloraphidium curvatum]
MPLEYALQFRGKFPDPGPWRYPPAKEAKLSQPLGVDALPNQTVIRSRRKPYVFNLMVAGESGLGKTTFINTLFDAPLKEHWERKNVTDQPTVHIQSNVYLLNEKDKNGKDVALQLTVIDTPGFGDALNRETNFDPIAAYINQQYAAYYASEGESSVRPEIEDTRIHCLLYFVSPNGKGLRDIDVEFLKRMGEIANVIPVIAKADTLTQKEMATFKAQMLSDLESNNIKIYPNSYCEDTEVIADLVQHIPFSVIGSDNTVEYKGQRGRGRNYRWGAVFVEAPEHCDFGALRDMTIRRNMMDLIATTHSIHYANYRATTMRGANKRDSLLPSDDTYDENVALAQEALKKEMQAMEEDIRAKFVVQVKEKETQLKDREEQLGVTRQQLMQDLEAIRQAIQEEAKELEEIERARGLRR